MLQKPATHDHKPWATTPGDGRSEMLPRTGYTRCSHHSSCDNSILNPSPRANTTEIFAVGSVVWTPRWLTVACHPFATARFELAELRGPWKYIPPRPAIQLCRRRRQPSLRPPITQARRGASRPKGSCSTRTVQIHIHAHVHMHKHINMHACTLTFTYTYICMCMCICTCKACTIACAHACTCAHAALQPSASGPCQ